MASPMKGGEIVITREGHPVARLTPCPERPKPLFGRNRDNIRIVGNVSEPLDVVWEAAEAGPWDDRL